MMWGYRTVVGICLLVGASLANGADKDGADKDSRRRRSRPSKIDPARMLERFDSNGDGYLSSEEGPAPIKSRFDRLDANKDGKLSKQELEKLFETFGNQSRKGRSGESNAPPAGSERHPDRLKVGDRAPDFTLSDPTGKTKITLSSFRGKKPVVLVFGSYT